MSDYTPVYENEIPLPGMRKGSEFTPDELLASTAGFTQAGVTFEPGRGIVPLGCGLGRLTATKRWVAYDNAASDGSEVCRGINRRTVDTGTDPDGPLVGGNIVRHGIVKNSKLSGIDSNAITDLNARADTVQDLFVF